ncbi:MAG: pantoate--beta-alanine ligase [Persicimonas sp.]
MQVVKTVDAFRRARSALRGTVGFVPTMGYLHRGHLELMRTANARCDHLVVSIFVNPTQFGPGEDLDSYPRDPRGDRQKCADLGCELLLMPDSAQMYAPDHATSVEVGGLDEVLCGARRPGHFEGVATVVTKLFNIVQPDVAVFGRKDYQQLAILRRMTRDLNFPIAIVGVPTVREDDGLAISSRNKYLDERQRRDARVLSQALKRGWQAYDDGERDGEALVGVVSERLRQVVGSEAIDYVECVHPESLVRYQADQRHIAGDEGAVIAVAVFFGGARLIDNLRLDRPLPGALM